MADENWITPAEAESFVASHQGFGGFLLGEAKAQILTWIVQDKLRTMALEVTRWDHESSSPSGVTNRCDTENGNSIAGISCQANPVYRQHDVQEFPLVKSQCCNYAMTVRDWADAGNAGADGSMLWSASELTHRLMNQEHPEACITYAGIRMAKADIERRIAVAGWPAPKCDNSDLPDVKPQPRAKESGRRPANWWPDFAEELAVYIHSEGIPAGHGQEGQSAMIDEIFRRLSARGKDEPSRTTVQPVLRAVLNRLRSAGNQ